MYEQYTTTPDDDRIEGFDPEVADDIGIPTSAERASQQFRSGEAVLALMTRELPNGHTEHEALNREYGRVFCANCNKPGCRGCGSS